MTRHTRDQIERLEAISFGINRVARGLNWTLLIVVAGAALAGGSIGYWLQGTWRAAFGGGGWAALLAIIGLVVFTWDIVRRAIDQTQRPVDEGDVVIGDLVRTGEREWRAPTEPPFRDVRRLGLCWRWLRDIHYGDATFSQDGTNTKRGGCSYGLTRQEVSHIKEWAITTARWYFWINETNGSGDWTVRGREAIATLANAGTGDVQDAWEAALIVRGEALPPDGDETPARESGRVTDGADGQNRAVGEVGQRRDS